ncbi:MAG: DNA mismatch repair protein MutS, partial [Myxococcota bacterium]|nr:DNA mismatch repair protein MutS [Myxococcota bacterium]
GLSIAWAVAEYLHDTKGLEARTLFATHYHELIELAEEKPHLANAHFEVREWEDDVIFLRRLVAGGANRSYGIQVARLAGLPGAVIGRAREILAGLEDADAEQAVGRAQPAEQAQLTLALSESHPDRNGARAQVIDELKTFALDESTPLEAMTAIQRWREKLESSS